MLCSIYDGLLYKNGYFPVFISFQANFHCVKSVCIRSFYGPYFPALGLNTQNKYTVQMQENTAQKTPNKNAVFSFLKTLIF